VWYINILNQKHYEETGEYLVFLYCVGERFDDVLDCLYTSDIRDLRIVSYELPFELKSNGYETLCNLQEKGALLYRLGQMQGTQYGLRFKELCDHFYPGEIEKYIMYYETIRWLSVANYKQLLKILVEADYISYRFVFRFFDFQKFLETNEEFCTEVIETLGVGFTELLVQRVKEGEFYQYLNFEEITSYLKDILRVLETPVGFFISEHHLFLLKNESGDLEFYTTEIMALVEKKKKARAV